MEYPPKVNGNVINHGAALLPTPPLLSYTVEIMLCVKSSLINSLVNQPEHLQQWTEKKKHIEWPQD